MRKIVRVLTVVAGVAGGTAACSDALSVPNKNNPGTDQVLKRPSDVEQLLGTGYNTVHQGTLGTAIVVSGAGVNDNVQNQLQVLALENYSSLANFGMGPRGGLPRNPIQNYRNNPVASGNFRDFSTLERVARSAADGIARFNEAGFTTGDSARDMRARAFGYFVMGTALGNLALVYDSLAVVSPATPPAQVTPFVGYAEGMKTALLYLDTALVIASKPGADKAYPLPSGWVNGNTLKQDEFKRLIRSYRARFRAGVARTPVERQAADWTAIIDDAENGLKADLNIQMDPSIGWQMAWPIQHNAYGSWHQMTPYIIGMADTSHAPDMVPFKTINFEEWLTKPISAKTPESFLIRTPDRRFPAGDDRATQLTSSGGESDDVVPPNGQYFRNRASGKDVFDGTWGNSPYDFARFRAFFNNKRIGPYPVMTRAELRLLAAEGYIYKGNLATAAVKIDSSRTANQLPSVAGISSLATPVPGAVYTKDATTGKAVLVAADPAASNCVPRVPLPAGGTACGNIFEAMKWEKRMETAYTGYGAWYFDSRGWGDLPQGTALSFPVPYQEMDARAEPAYSLGGLGGTAAALLGTYGY
ncbi:MAG: hypothetical protein ACJ79S_13535 [Gemmatimonadaceae bacterium]